MGSQKKLRRRRMKRKGSVGQRLLCRKAIQLSLPQHLHWTEEQLGKVHIEKGRQDLGMMGPLHPSSCRCSGAGSRQGSCSPTALQGPPSSRQTAPRTCTDPSRRPPGDAGPRERAGGNERVSVVPPSGAEEGPPELPGVPEVPEGHAR